jgi:REP element-mobilizing transposase RayT
VSAQSSPESGGDDVEAASRRLPTEDDPDEFATTFFNPFVPVERLSGHLPHWRQDGVAYFVTFRLADSLPADLLAFWRIERDAWKRIHPSPLTPEDEAEYRRRFSARIECWLDQGAGSCVLRIPECRRIVEKALGHFDGVRYALGESVVAGNHVHAVVAPKPGNGLSSIVHSWKSYTAKEMLKEEAAVRGLGCRTVWQKESYDHIVRSAAALTRIEEYIRSHKR